ncbi:hypothetical protein GALL_474090 [mine drainage metagenome]|uniref:Uncharacterized protein n=1 Tax=mine drainage metagenome TaxID=410659 RepID=A0A1J5PJJ0_9ZZZZ
MQVRQRIVIREHVETLVVGGAERRGRGANRIGRGDGLVAVAQIEVVRAEVEVVQAVFRHIFQHLEPGLKFLRMGKLGILRSDRLIQTAAAANLRKLIGFLIAAVEVQPGQRLVRNLKRRLRHHEVPRLAGRQAVGQGALVGSRGAGEHLLRHVGVVGHEAGQTQSRDNVQVADRRDIVLQVNRRLKLIEQAAAEFPVWHLFTAIIRRARIEERVLRAVLRILEESANIEVVDAPGFGDGRLIAVPERVRGVILIHVGRALRVSIVGALMLTVFIDVIHHVVEHGRIVDVQVYLVIDSPKLLGVVLIIAVLRGRRIIAARLLAVQRPRIDRPARRNAIHGDLRVRLGRDDLRTIPLGPRQISAERNVAAVERLHRLAKHRVVIAGVGKPVRTGAVAVTAAIAAGQNRGPAVIFAGA